MRSVINKIDQLRVIVCDSKPDLICLCETWTNSEHTSAFLNIPDYQIISRADRTDTTSGIGGGLLIYAKRDVQVFELAQPTNIEQFNQYLSVKINLANEKCLNLYLIYRPHKLYNDENVGNNNSKLCRLIERAEKPAMLIGDFNCGDINWNNLTATNPQSKIFLSTVQDNFYSQYVDFQTHNSGSTLDLVLTSEENMVFDIENEGPVGASDHSAFYCKLNATPELTKMSEAKLNWKNADKENLQKVFTETDWDSSFELLNTEQSWDLFTGIFNAAVEQYVPKHAKNSNSRQPPWMNKDLLKDVRKKRRKWKVYKKYGNLDALQEYNNLQKKVKTGTKLAKKKYERKLAQNAKKNPKPFYTYLKTKTSNKESVGPLKDENRDLITDKGKMAEMLNKFFSSVFTRENTEDIPEPETQTIHFPMPEIEITEEKVKKKLLNLRKDSSPGPDGISPRTLIEFADELAHPLFLIIKKSYETGEVPKEWKQANVTPIYKKGSKNDVSNYRPVSLTSVPCRVTESIIKDEIVNHLALNKLIRESQHGFRTNRSCLSNLLEYLNILTKLLDEGKNIDMIYLDFAKAFDKVPAQRLLKKIRGHGIEKKSLKWISNWLSERLQRVVLLGEASDWAEVLSGVPQGSVLGPLCFIIFINDIDLAIDILLSILFKFADDTKAGRVVATGTDQSELQNELNKFLEWAETWQMSFNSSKCKVMHLGRRNPGFSYTMGGHAPAGTILESVKEEKDVGVWISDNLKPSHQCAKAAKKANSVLGQMSRAVTYRDRLTWVGLYKQYVRPHLEYCAQAWSPWTEQDKGILESVQERAIRMVSGLSGKTYAEKLAELNIQSLEERRIRGDMIQTWKIIHLEGFKCSQFFTLVRDNVPNNGTRFNADPLNIVQQRANLEVRKNFFSLRVPEHWNALPTTVKNATSVNNFKNLYDNFIGLTY